MDCKKCTDESVIYVLKCEKCEKDFVCADIEIRTPQDQRLIEAAFKFAKTELSIDPKHCCIGSHVGELLQAIVAHYEFKRGG